MMAISKNCVHRIRIPMQAFEIPIESLRWFSCGDIFGADPMSHLIATLRIGTAQLHLEAIEVYEPSSEQGGVEGMETAYWDLLMFSGGNAPFETTEIFGRKYVIYAVPYSE